MATPYKSAGDNDASASLCGWEFQVGAAICLFLDNIREATSIKVEGKKQDIEIFTDEKTYLAQAKSVQQMHDQSHWKEQLQRSIVSLSKYDDKQYELIYVSNLSDPLNIGDKSFTLGTDTEFNILSDESQKLIRGFADHKDFPKTVFRVKNHPFLWKRTWVVYYSPK